MFMRVSQILAALPLLMILMLYGYSYRNTDMWRLRLRRGQSFTLCSDRGRFSAEWIDVGEAISDGASFQKPVKRISFLQGEYLFEDDLFILPGRFVRRGFGTVRQEGG